MTNTQHDINTQHHTYVGSSVVDRLGEPVGTVKDVVFEEADLTPSWLVARSCFQRASPSSSPARSRW